MIVAPEDASRFPELMCVAGGVVLLAGLWRARRAVADARGLDKVVALRDVCYAVPLAVFGALHLFGPQIVRGLVPPYMPWRDFWVVFVGVSLVAGGLSIATGIGSRWAAFFFGAMMFLFVAMIHLPGALRQPGRIIWTIVCRETSFGGGAWIIAGLVGQGWPLRARDTLVMAGRALVMPALVVFGVMHFLHPLGLPGVPLVKQMPDWVPAQSLIGYLTGAGLLATAVSVVARWKTRLIASAVAAWLLALLLIIYFPVLFGALSQTAVGARMEGVNYFADTLLFVGVLLAVASAAPGSPSQDSGGDVR